MNGDPWKFDFGCGPAAIGYTKITADDLYDSKRGYGFQDVAKITFRDRGEPYPLKRDLCIPVDSRFLLDVPNGNYMVSLLMGDAIVPTCTTVKAVPGRLLLRNRMAAAGQFVRETFAVHVRDGRLALAFSGPAPRLNAMEITYAPQALTVYLAGDSTVTDQPEDGFPYAGWGQLLPAFFKADVAVANHAESGRSSKSFIDEGRLDVMLATLQANDYLFIQFGHNDQKPDEARFTDPQSSYKAYLQRYIEAAQARGAHPVLVTSVHRRYFQADGKLRDTHAAYLDAVRALAEAEGVPLIDLAAMSQSMFEALGPEGTQEVFMWGAPGEFLPFPDGIQDNTHFQERGAYRLAELVISRIRELGLWPLILYLRESSPSSD